MKDLRKLFASKDFKGNYSNKSCRFGPFCFHSPTSLPLAVCVCTSSSLNNDIIFTAVAATGTEGCLDPVMSYLLFTRVLLDTFALQIYF